MICFSYDPNGLSSLNWGTFPDWISVILTGLTLLIARKALKTWQHEKMYDVRIEALAKSRIALDLIMNIRSPVSFEGEIDEELAKRYLKHNEQIHSYDRENLIFHSRLKNYKREYEDILLLRERLWAMFGEAHIFYTFYDRIIKLVNELNQGHIELAFKTKHKETWPPDSDLTKELMAELRKLLYQMSDDQITIELKALHDRLILERRRK